MSNSLALIDNNHEEISLQDLGTIMVKSGFFQDTRDGAQAIVKILAGRELGFGPIASMVGVNIIKGRPALSANLMAAAVKRSGRYNYRVTEMSDKAVELAFFEMGEEVGRSRFTAEDAKRAGTQNMDKFPRNMLFARALSNGAKWFTPDIFGGPVYTPEELGVPVNEDGEIIDTTPIERPQQRPANLPKSNYEQVQAQREVMTVDEAREVLTPKGTRFGDLTDEQLETMRNYPKSTSEQKQAAELLLAEYEFSEPPMPDPPAVEELPDPEPVFDPAAWLVENQLSENLPAARNMIKLCKITVTPETFPAWARAYRAWRDLGADSKTAAGYANSGETPK